MDLGTAGSGIDGSSQAGKCVCRERSSREEQESYHCKEAQIDSLLVVAHGLLDSYFFLLQIS